jgi:SAM-dependent methyltransferase
MSRGPKLDKLLAGWSLPEGGDLLDLIEEMIRPALLAGRFGTSTTRFVSGLQYHLGGAQDTRELADLAALSSDDHVLDVCCFLGGPAVQLAHSVGCCVSGIDLDAKAIAAAERIAELSALDDLLEFRVADAADLPFPDRAFSIIWNQCSLDSNEQWLREFDRVLLPGGRFAFTFQRKGLRDDRWTLSDLTSLVVDLGYTVLHADDITERDIEIGWRALDAKLSAHEDRYSAVLGEAWVREAHREFIREIERMKAGEYGNARVVAQKLG